jgi:hypothetical protein
MKMLGNGLRIAAGAVILAAAITFTLSVPGVVSDRDSIVPAHVPAMTHTLHGATHAGCDRDLPAAEGTP